MMDVKNYNENRRIYSALLEHNGIVCGFWLVGQDYHNASGYYGAYPPSYLKRMGLLFPDRKDFWVLHLFSGMVPRGTWKNELTFDINPELDPTIVGNADELSKYVELKYAVNLILADPPYDENHIKYGTEKVNKRKVIKECAKILPKGGYLVWIDTIIPIWAKADGWKLRGTIGMVQSTNHKCRVITILEKVM